MFPSDESHDQKMKVAIVATPVPPSYPQPTDHESSNPQIKEEGSERKLLPSDSNISVPPFPFPNSEEPDLSQSVPPQPPTLPVLERVEQQELGKALIAPIVAMVIALVSNHDSISKTAGTVIAVALCFGFTFICNGILLPTTQRNALALLQLVGIALAALSVFAFLFSVLPPYLKWIPFACGFLSLFSHFICSWKKEANVAGR